MRALRSSVVSLAVAGAVGVFVAVGCSADGAGSPEDTTATPPAETPGAQLPGSTSGGTSGGTPTDAGKPVKDAAPKDSAVDAGPPPPVAGTPCTVLDEVRKKSCGACGTQSTVCLADGDAGGGTWSIYSGCEGELAGGCTPGAVVTEACGNCGMVTKTCTQYCAFTSSACTGQPAGSCVPGGVDLSSAGCGADVFRQRTCQGTCVYNNFGATCDPPPAVVEVGPTPGSVTSTIAILTQGQALSRMSGTCPTATLSTTVTSPYVYLQVHNPLARAAVVAIYNSLAPGGVAYKTVLAAYDGVTSPTDDASRKLCVKGASTFGTVALTGDSKFASLDGTKAVTIAAGATVSVYIASYNAYDPLKPTDSTGKVKLNVQTVSLQ
jgi:hypothetical protein